MQGIVTYIRKDLFNDSRFYSTLFKVALPIIIQNLIASSLNMVDTMMIGQVGENPIAAVGIANQYFLLFNVLLFGVFSGCGIFIAQFWGKRDLKSIKKIEGLGLSFGVVIAMLFTLIALIAPEAIIGIFNKDPEVIVLGAKYLRIVCISYVFMAITFNYSFALRSLGKTVLPMVISAIALLVNTFLNWVFIFGNLGAPQMGVEGAALATTIARVVECVLLVGYIYITKNELAANFKEMFSLSFEFIRSTFKTILPVVLNDLFWVLGSTMYSIAYGRISVQAMAAVQICVTVHNLFMVATYGMAYASTTILGNEIGAGKEDRAKDYAKKFGILSIILGIIMCISLNLLAPFIISFFNVSQVVAGYGRVMLTIIGIAFLFKTFNLVVIVGILRGGGDAKYGLIVESLTMWLVGVPLTFLGAFVFKWGIELVYSMIIVEEFVKFFFSVHRLVSNKWIKNVTEIA